jgi:hypothetical protein
MPEFQDTAFVREDWTLFRTIGTLCQRAGVPATHLARLVLKELVDNALDAAGDAPVTCSQQGDGFVIEDAGSGIPGCPADIAQLFSIRRPLVSSKLWRLPSRGALGNGLRVVAGAVLASGGVLAVWTGDRCIRLFPQDDGTTRWEAAPADFPVGTRIAICFGPSLARDPAPLCWAQRALAFRTAQTSYRGRASPHWYDSDAFFELLQAAGRRPVRALVAELEGATGSKAGRLCGNYRSRRADSLSRRDADTLLGALQAGTQAVRPERLGYVGRQEHLPAGYARETTTFTVRPGQGTCAAVVPAVVEAWAEPASEDAVEILVNRTPVTGDVSLVRQSERTDIGLFGCNLALRCWVGRTPLDLRINVTTPHLPLTSDGKAPNLERVAAAIRAAVEAAAKRGRRSGGGLRTRARSAKDIVLDHLEEGIAKAGGGGRYSARQLCYAIRDYVAQELGVPLSWGNFETIITDYEADLGHDLPGIARDPRGTLYHPHTHEAISLGTMAVEQYARPPWTFNKLLYIEKEGYFTILQDAGWPEKNDCALLTAKGFPTRAARDVIDLLAETDEEITIFAVHDADASGTLIYQALQEATRARPKRRITVINLGLEPWEGLALGLPVEQTLRKATDRRAPVGGYVWAKGPKWEAWLQGNRIELNAMPTPQFIARLDAKVAQHGPGKLIPPDAVLTERLAAAGEATVREALEAQILQEAGYEERVSAAMTALGPALAETGKTLRQGVEARLAEAPAEHWAAFVTAQGQQLAQSGEQA